jgi:trimeric autotransporter adhesin
LVAGNYYVTVTDANGCTKSKTATISDVGGADVVLDSVLHAGCGSIGGSVFIGVIGGVGPFSYSWSNGAATEDITGLSAGNYDVTVTGSNGCASTSSAAVEAQQPFGDPICLVTVDSITGSNLIAWEKDASSGIQAFNIYKETSASNVYLQVGSVPFDSLSRFIDYSSNPQVKSYRYKISAIDSCGIESDLSDVHKTMHLTINLGLNNSINLIWDHYVGFSFNTYYIYRYTNSTGWEALDSIPSSNTSFTDLTPPSLSNDLKYIVEARHPDGCTATKAAENHNSSRSNVSQKAVEIRYRQRQLLPLQPAATAMELQQQLRQEELRPILICGMTATIRQAQQQRDCVVERIP